MPKGIYKRTKYHRKRISEGVKNSPEKIKQVTEMGKANKGREVTWGQKLSKSLKGYKKTSEHCQNISKALRGEKCNFWKDGRSYNSAEHSHQQARIIWENYYKIKIPKGYLIHHRDFNPFNTTFYKA